MPFDGNNHIDGGIPLLTPYAYTPRAPATAIVPAYALHTAYNYSRAAHRQIGMQTYQLTHLTSVANNYALDATALTGIAEFRATLPDHATVIFCRASYAALTEGTYTASHRVVVTDVPDGGSDTDTGATDAQSSSARSGEQGGVGGWVSYDHTQPHIAEFWVQRSNTLGSGSTPLTITAEAFAVDAESGLAVPYRPFYVACWWESL